jgi:hypothetical protein
MLEEILEDKSRKWLMSERDKIAIIGIAAIVRPGNALEIGVYEGGCTWYLSRFCTRIDSVDPCFLMRKFPDNCTPHHMKSVEFFENHDKGRWGLIVIDADHSVRNACNDLEYSILHGKYILMHDTANGDCREGYEAAIRLCGNHIKYCNLDIVEGERYEEISWGGVGLVITK